VRQLLPVPSESVDLVELYGRLGRSPSGRPKVRVNMIASVDGAAAVAGRSGGLGGPADRAVFAALRSLADVILVGASTVRDEGYGPVRLDDDARARRVGWGLPPVPPIAVVTRSCQLGWDTPLFRAAEVRPVVVTTRSAADADRERAAAVAEVVVAGDRDVDLVAALAALRDRGADNVLAEGGPSINGQLVVAGLVDELCVTVAPTVVGGDARRIVAGGATRPVGLELRHVLEADGYLFLRYRR